MREFVKKTVKRLAAKATVKNNVKLEMGNYCGKFGGRGRGGGVSISREELEELKWLRAQHGGKGGKHGGKQGGRDWWRGGGKGRGYVAQTDEEECIIDDWDGWEERKALMAKEDLSYLDKDYGDDEDGDEFEDCKHCVGVAVQGEPLLYDSE